MEEGVPPEQPAPEPEPEPDEKRTLGEIAAQTLTKDVTGTMRIKGWQECG